MKIRFKTIISAILVIIFFAITGYSVYFVYQKYDFYNEEYVETKDITKSDKKEIPSEDSANPNQTPENSIVE